MIKYLRLIWVLFLVISGSETFAATYFVRPYLEGAVYGADNGSSYGNAWNGMTALNAKWGSPVGPGDTVYICGTHLSGRPSNIEGWLRPTVSGTQNARIIISGACPNDSGGNDAGTIYAVHLQMNSSAWTDQDADGVYSQPYGGCTYPFLLEDGSRRLNWIPIDTTQSPPVPTIPYSQWPAGSFTQLGCGGDIYYKPSSGIPANHTIHTAHSALAVLDNQQYINIQNLRLFAGSNPPIILTNADFIRIENNEIQWKGISISADSDDGEILGNKIHDMLGTAIYLITGGTNVNAQSNDRWHIAHNEIYNISPGNIAPGCDGCTPYFDGGDRHGIGVQGGTNGAVIEYNHIHHVGGEGIIFYNWSNYTENGVRVGNNQRDNLIRYNYIHDIKDLWPGCLSGQSVCSNERGIELGGDSQPPLTNTITGNVVHHNVLARVNQMGLRFKATTENGVYGWRVLNNTVYQSGIGIATSTNDPGSPAPYSGVEYRNNLIMNPISAHIFVTLPAGSTVSKTDMRDLIDRNIYYPDGLLFRTLAQSYSPDLETNYNFSDWQALFNLDANSLTANPLLTNPSTGDFRWAGTPPLIPGAGDFHLMTGSPGINTGAVVGISQDIEGHSIDALPDIGAYEAPSADLLSTALTATLTGTTLKIDDAVKNQGSVAAGAFDINFYLSSDTVYQVGTDVFVCKRSIASLASGASNPASGTQRTTCTVPASTLGRYYVIAVADAGNTVAESNESNNARATPGTLNIGPDLTHTALSMSKSGNNLLITDTVKNQGSQSAGAFTISFYLSTDSTYQNGTDIPLCSRPVSSLTSGATNNRTNGNCTWPSAASYGVNYHLIAVDDEVNAVSESDETNNIRVTTGTVKWP